MDRLTVKHEYDPKTGFIVARETVALPPLIRDAPPLDAASAASSDDDGTVSSSEAGFPVSVVDIDYDGGRAGRVAGTLFYPARGGGGGGAAGAPRWSPHYYYTYGE